MTEETRKERFASWHKDCSVDNMSGRRKVSNDHMWCYPRTCYGDVEIPSETNCVATWQIKVKENQDMLNGINIGYVCIGIDSDKQTSTTFYTNKYETCKSPCYGYESTGKIYEECKVMKQYVSAEPYRSKMNRDTNDVIMEINTGSKSLTFYKYKNNEKVFQHCCKIKTGSNITYRLAVCIKNAAVAITDFNIKWIKKKRAQQSAQAVDSQFMEQKTAYNDNQLYTVEMKTFQQNMEDKMALYDAKLNSITTNVEVMNTKIQYLLEVNQQKDEQIKLLNDKITQLLEEKKNNNNKDNDNNDPFQKEIDELNKMM